MKKTLLTLAVSLALASSAAVFAEDKAAAAADKKKEQTYSSMIADKKVISGLFTLYQDEKTGEHLLQLTEAQLNKPFLYFAQTLDGVTEAGHFRGAYRETKLIEFRRYFDRIDVISKTPRFHFDAQSALSRAADANISEAVLASLKIEKQEQDKFLVKANSLLLSEALHKISPWANPNDPNAKDRFKLGKLDDKKSRIVKHRPYPANLDVVVDYVFADPNPGVRGGNALSDPRSVSIKVQHSFIALPENNFQPRFDDARVGYFTTQVDDMTSAEWAPFRDMIHRWDLQKKDPNAALSEPVKPIVWWIENTTPIEWRDTVAAGVLAWNSAFEKAGFKNALEVRIQPDDADWDAGDINYNVLRWTSSPNPPFGGYGPSLANPLTGEILGADIMLEYVFMKNRWIFDSLYTDGASQLTSEAAGHWHANGVFCSAGHQLQQNLIMAGALGTGLPIDNNEILRQGLMELVLHEVGHTLGLNHNMRASNLWNAQDVHDKTKTQGILTGSVMDYTPANIAPIGKAQGDIFQVKPGPYDDWAIEFGYSPALSDAAAEQARLETILARSVEPALAFGNDADDMRAPGRHIDPRVMIGDMSSDPVAYASDRMQLIEQLFGKIAQTALQDGQSYQQLVTSANVLFGQYRSQADVVSRQIGGVYVERNVVGAPTDRKPLTPVPLAQQKAAMQLLTEKVFAPEVLTSMQPLFNQLLPQRRGFSHYGRNLDPKAHEMILGMQRSVLNQLLHKAVLQRISDSALYGNQYSLTAFMQDLTNGIFVDPRKASSQSHNLQVEYVKRLIAIAGLEKASDYDNLAKAAALLQLTNIQSSKLPRGVNDAAKAQKALIDLMISKALQA